VAPVRVRACQSNLRSTWNEIGPTDAGRTIDLALQPTTPTPVTVEVDDAPTPAIHTIRYRRDGGLEYRDSVAGGDKLELFLDPGNYHFAVVVRDSNRLMIEDDVDIHVDTKPVAVRLRSSPGGTFAVKATDGHGAWVRGTCTVRDTAGHEWRGCFLGQDNTEWRGCFQGQGSPEGRPGELLATGVNTFLRRLPPGDYELHCDFGARGQHREVVTIRANETTDVRIRLP
jgi:hypothetical protein